MVDTTSPAITLDREKMKSLGIRLWGLFGDYKKDRRGLEEQWLQNLRQFKGIYDPEVERKIAPTQSKAYPKLTRRQVIGTVARLMEMLFPQTDKNYAVDPSPIPDIAREDLQRILDEVSTAKAGEGEVGEDGTVTLADDEIESAIMAFAKQRAAKMDKTIEDQMDEMDYITLARRVIFSAVLYSAGVMVGPWVKTEKRRTWRKNVTGQYEAVEVKKRIPWFDFLRLWDYYPDLSAKEMGSQDGHFVRHVMSRQQVKDLADRADFLGDEILAFLRENPEGNYKEEWWETDLRATGTSDRKNVSNLAGRKYELAEYWGSVTGHDLQACGVTMQGKQLAAMYEANLWMLGHRVVKCKLNPYDAKIRPAHVFVYEEDDISLLGTALPNVMRDSQLAVAEATRMLLDNASVVCGPMLEINLDALEPGTDPTIHANKIWWRNNDNLDPSVPAVKGIEVNSHIPELLQIIEVFSRMGEQETMLPPPALGDVQKGSEAYRTTSVGSALLGAASLPIRDTVRNFDKFTQSAVGSLYNWNMQFNEDPNIKGDYTIRAKGSTSLIAKEVRANSLDWFSTQLTAEERAHVNTRKLLVEKMKVRDLDPELLEDEKTVQQNLARQQQKAEELAQLQAAGMVAEIREKIAKAFKEYALGAKAGSDAQVKTFEAIMGAIAEIANGSDTDQGRGTSAGGGTAPAEGQPA